MNYILELSVDLRKNASISEFEDIIASIAFDFNATIEDMIYETEGRGKIIDHNNCIFILSLHSELNKLKELIRNIKRVKVIHIDCIYTDYNKIDIIYESTKYSNRNNRNNIHEKHLEKKFQKNTNKQYEHNKIEIYNLIKKN